MPVCSSLPEGGGATSLPYVYGERDPRAWFVSAVGSQGKVKTSRAKPADDVAYKSQICRQHGPRLNQSRASVVSENKRELI